MIPNEITCVLMSTITFAITSRHYGGRQDFMVNIVVDIKIWVVTLGVT